MERILPFKLTDILQNSYLRNIYTKFVCALKKIYFGDLSKHTALLTKGISSTRNSKKVVVRSSK